MSKGKFNWKSLFVNENETSEKIDRPNEPPVQNVPSNSFPTSIPNNTNFENINTASGNNPFIGEIFGIYEKGFEGLNHEGFDFYELYKSVVAVGINNPQSYQMAFAMGKSLRPEIDKQFLLDKSQYYITEIEKVHQNYDVIGNSKHKQLLSSIASKKESLSKQISDLQQQIAKLQGELQSKSNELNNLDSQDKGEFLEIQQKLEANNLAKQKLLDSIKTVIAGINQYL